MNDEKRKDPIKYGKATVPGTRHGWALPGGREVLSRMSAYDFAKKIDAIISGSEK